jgi:hypothetical protein
MFGFFSKHAGLGGMEGRSLALVSMRPGDSTWFADLFSSEAFLTNLCSAGDVLPSIVLRLRQRARKYLAVQALVCSAWSSCFIQDS